MKTCLLAAVAALALNFLLTVGMAHADSGVSFRPSRVHAFAAESANSVVVREGRERYLRLTLAESCPAVTGAERIAFQIGSTLTVADEPGARVPVTRGSAPAVITTETPHAHLVAISSNSRVACRLAGVAEADRSAFETTAAANGQHDNRYAGDGRAEG